MNLHDMLMYAWYVLQTKLRTMKPKRPAKRQPKRLLPEPKALGMELVGPAPSPIAKPPPVKVTKRAPERLTPEIRAWTRNDLPGLEEVMEGEGQEGMTFDKTMLEEHVTGSGVVGLVALREGCIVGFIVATPGMVIHIAVRREEQWTGVGTALWKGLIAAMDDGTTRHMRVKIRDDNPTAHIFFREMGFICTVMIVNSIEGSDDAIYMMMFPKPPAWRIGTLYIIDGEDQRTIYKPYPRNKT